MNTAMWRHSITKRQVAVLEQEWGFDQGQNGWIEMLMPVEMELACGDSGNGVIRGWVDVVKTIAILRS